MSTPIVNLRFLVHGNHPKATLSTLSNTPEVIEDIESAINEFSKKHPDLHIMPSNLGGFEVNVEAYQAIQSIIALKI